MKPLLKTALLLIPAILVSTSCKKSKDDGGGAQDDLQSEILANISANVCTASYVDMADRTTKMQADINTFIGSGTEADLATCRADWKAIRVTWEQTESWLFGPVEGDKIDPRIDSWPVNFNDLDGILANSDGLTESYVDGLEDELKGFHPIEYILWGKNGNRTAASFTAREKQYLVALTQNLVKLTQSVRDTWKNGYSQQLATAGSGSTEFSTKQAAFVQLVAAMADICGEVGDSKIKDPFDAQDASQEESPFAKNSFIDFTNNLLGTMDVYQGKFGGSDGKGLEDLVQANNRSLDADIKAKYAAAVASLQTFTVPFGQAIKSEPTKVQNAMDKISAYHDVLENQLNGFVLQYVK
ncbi:MAG: hypothetical protein INR69_07510 [Mucilaginibacter polytrichastri]|nr:hypothetical protein [Mucilaginibacter polytrichastri]